MPVGNIFRNSAHYWILAGFNIAYWVYAPTSPTAQTKPNPLLVYPGLALFAFGELVSFSSHITLQNLRGPGDAERGIPVGFGFGLVTCPNYLFETLAWVGVWLVSGQNWTVILFIVIAMAPMMVWAKRKYRKEFSDKYEKKRFVMLPGIW